MVCGAGLAAVKLSTAEGPQSKKPDNFPTLATISEEGEMIEDGVEEDSKADKEIDPEDVDDTETESESNNNHGDGPEAGVTSKQSKGNSPAKQAEFKVWAHNLGYDGPGIIVGYGIRWNITYESRNQAYKA
ncbi:hypothetical protein PTTG_07115 [Puccinia triticina 1-1 BBBD Race 1]|uniref:Uncharacterized protein n=1 Tax=Puccinia triticina (isolate 1-1 / race 1 (BBBD)) TaxID=630390 RepID=A0A180GAF0_PUCT1|nr:hypothetical protein PTTG_07115 [Puccinia triticina 1-1 BBBD Race 1]